MNLLDYHATPIWRAWEAIHDLAASEGVELRESELIGLAPLGALLDVADHAGVDARLPVERRIELAAASIRIRGFKPTMALELRLERMLAR
jgi:glutamate formiminotransferase